MSKTFVYQVKETNADGFGLTMDKHIVTVNVTVTDDGRGHLNAQVSYDNSTASDADKAVEDAAAFTNTYAAAPVSDGTGTPAGVAKKLEGNRPVGLQAGEFGFTMNVEAADGSPADGFVLPEDATAANAAPDKDGTGAVTFGNITFTKAGTYHVTVREDVP